MSLLTWTLASCLTLAATPDEDEILRGADERIQKHRTGELVLRLRGSDDRPIRGPVEITQTRHAFLFGSNVFSLGRYQDPADNAAYEKHFAALFNFATLPFYWWHYEPEAGRPDHARVDRMAAWCKAHNIVTKGHPLAWNYYDPRWIPADAHLAGKAQMARIERDVTRFRGRVDIWDVVNEATAYDRPQCLKNSPVLTQVIRDRGVGPYVRAAFRAARAANPGATLVINDYVTEEEYATKVLAELVDENRKPLYDVIGIQCHQHGGAWPAQRTWEICERFARFGRPLHFTEATILSGKLGWELRGRDPSSSWPSTSDGEERQAREVERFYTVLFSHPAVEAITWWDFADRHAWQGAPAGFLRADMTPKPAYHALKALIMDKWWTRARLDTGPDGQVRLRAFYGDYEVHASDGDRRLVGTFRMDKTTKGPIEVKLAVAS